MFQLPKNLFFKQMKEHVLTTPAPTIVKVLKHFPEIRTAILFGSMAKGNARPDSDMDLAVDLGTPINSQQKTRLISNLAEASGRPIDLIDLAKAGEPLLGQILHNGKRLTGSDHDFANLLSRHLLDEADFMPYYRRLLAQRRKMWIGM